MLRFQATHAFPKFAIADRTLRCTPRRISQSLNSSLAEQAGLEIIWDNESPSPGRVVKLGEVLLFLLNIVVDKMIFLNTFATEFSLMFQQLALQ